VGAVRRLKAADEATGGERIASSQEYLAHLWVAGPGVEERPRSLREHWPACGVEEGERQNPPVLTRSRPLADPLRELVAIDAKPAHRLHEAVAVHAARFPLQLVEQTPELAFGVGLSASGVERWLQLVWEVVNVATAANLTLGVVEAGTKLGDDEVEAETVDLLQCQLEVNATIVRKEVSGGRGEHDVLDLLALLGA
jgi:hypothetical protein